MSRGPGAARPAGIHANIVRAIGERIVNGELQSGDILPEQVELSRELGVSRTVVREATRVLTAKGLVESRPKRGTVVLPRSSWNLLDADVLAWQTEREPDLGLLKEIYEVREIFEPAAVRLAAERATPMELRAIREAFDSMSVAADAVAYLRADFLYHGTLVKATHNDHLIQLAGAFTAALHAAMRVTIRDGRDWRSFLDFSVPLHGAVVAAVERHDPDQAAALMLRLVDGSRRDTLGAMDTKMAGRSTEST